MAVLEDVKVLLGIQDDSQDGVLAIHIKAVTNAIITSIGTDTLPTALESVVTEIVVKRMEGPDAKSIARGDTTINYNLATPSENELSQYEPLLRKFRRLKTL